MSDFNSELGFQDCWDPVANSKLNKPAGGSVGNGGKSPKTDVQNADRTSAKGSDAVGGRLQHQSLNDISETALHRELVGAAQYHRTDSTRA